MKYIIENNKSNYKEEVDKIINDRKKEIFNFFNVEDIELPFNIYIYDSIESLVKGLKERGFINEPDYICACQKDEDNSLNFFEPKDNPSDNEWTKEEYKNVIFHELIHGIQFLLYKTTPEWINEGIAKYLDKTYSKGIKYLLDNYINNNTIPDQREIEEEFGEHNYDSYDYAYLMVSYLIETLGKDNFLELLKDNNKLNKCKNNLLTNSINYYNNKYNNKLNIYLNQDINNPKYLFHGSPKKLNKIIPILSHDSNNNKDNIGESIYLFPSFLKATPYAFKDTIKSNSKDLDWDFIITNNNEYPLMTMDNVNIDNNIIGYIYVFNIDNDMIKDNNSYQYKCYKELIPIDIIEIKLKDYLKYYKIMNNTSNKYSIKR